MEKKSVLGRVDHTLSKQIITWEQIEMLCREGMEHATVSVYIPPCYVKHTKEYTGEGLTICTVIGFPSGNMTTATKVFETENVVRNDANEIDMVVNIGMVGEGFYEQILEEIRQIGATCAGKCLKVIVETCLLTENEKKEMCRVVTQSGANYTRTSMGFSTDGATQENVALLRRYPGPRVEAKAVGGVAFLQDMGGFIALGADRLGINKLIPQRYGICRNMECVEI